MKILRKKRNDTYYYLEPPTNRSFYRILATIMSTISLGDQRWWGYKSHGTFASINRIIVTYCGPCCTTSMLVYPFLYFGELSANTLAIICCMLPVAVLVNLRVRLAKRKVYENVMKDFITKIHLYNYKDNDEHVTAIKVKAERLGIYTSYCLAATLMFDSILWCVVPLVNNIINMDAIQNRTMELQTCLYVWAPFDYRYNFYNWIIIHLCINVYTVSTGCGLLGVFDIIFYTIVFHLLGHIQILKHKFKTSFSGDLNDAEVKQRLVDTIEHHIFITRCFKDVEAAFGLNVTGNYLNNLVADSFFLFNIMFVAQDTGTIVIYCVMILVCLAELIVMSFILEEVRRESDDLPDIIYCVPWENWSTSNKKTLLIILAQVQPELAFVAAGGLRAGVRPMIAIIKSIFSYYVMLKSSIS